jgi:hypothetical protein
MMIETRGHAASSREFIAAAVAEARCSTSQMIDSE